MTNKNNELVKTIRSTIKRESAFTDGLQPVNKNVEFSVQAIQQHMPSLTQDEIYKALAEMGDMVIDRKVVNSQSVIVFDRNYIETAE